MDLIISIENERTRYNDQHNIEIINKLPIESLLLDCDLEKKNSIRIACKYKLDNVLLAILLKCQNYMNFIFYQSCLICKTIDCIHENLFYLIVKQNLIHSFRFITNDINKKHILKYINMEHYEQYPIHEACINMNLEILDFLIKNNSIINTYNTRLMPLHMSCLFRFYDGIYLLINSGADIHVIDKFYGQNLLHAMSRETISCQNYDYDQDNYIINYLLDNGVDEHLKDKFNIEPYQYGYMYGLEDDKWMQRCFIYTNRKLNILKNNYDKYIKENIEPELLINIINYIY